MCRHPTPHAHIPHVLIGCSLLENTKPPVSSLRLSTAGASERGTYLGDAETTMHKWERDDSAGEGMAELLKPKEGSWRRQGRGSG